MIALIFDDLATQFGNEYHPERPERLTHTRAYLFNKQPDWVWIKPRLASNAEVLRVHHPKHLERLRVPIDFDADTPYYPEIEEHARRAAGAAIATVDLALSGKKGFSLMRPPGHHATQTRAMGFCYLNSVAIAAHHALDIGCQRVAIWDFDAHHGNGTEAAVLGNQRIRFASIHQYPGYPGTGKVSRENVLNWPILPHTDAEKHAAAVHQALDRLLEFKPDLLLVSAGFDAYRKDPLTEMTLEQEHFAGFGRRLKETGLAAGVILEGGYSNDLPILVESFLAEWSDP
jgi:acetoin utilization deacetylase AcuC-like enzyme